MTPLLLQSLILHSLQLPDHVRSLRCLIAAAASWLASLRRLAPVRVAVAGLASLLVGVDASAVEFLVPPDPGDTLCYHPNLVIKAYPGAASYRWTFTRPDGSGLGTVVGGVRVAKDTPLQGARIQVQVEPLDSRGRVIRAGVSETWFRTCSTRVELAAPLNGQHLGSPVTFSFQPLPEESSVYGYYLFVKSPGASEPRRFDLGVHATAYLSTLAPGDHEWWVQARTQFDNDPESTHWIARVSSLPTFLEHPEGGEFCDFEEVPLHAEAKATPSFSYQWRRDGVDIPGASGPDWTVPAGEQGSYACVAFNAAGAVVSKAATVTRHALPPVALGEPVYDYKAGEIRITASGSADEYEWWLDDELLDETGPELVLTEAPEHPVRIHVVAVLDCGTVESAPLELQPPSPLGVTRKSPAQIVRLGDSVDLVFETSRPADTEWLSAAGNSTKGSSLKLTVATEEDAGSYAVTASDPFGIAEGTIEVLAVVAEPADQTVAEGKSVVMSAEVAGASPAIQWFKDGVALKGKTDLELTLVDVSAADAGHYSFDLTHLDSATFHSRPALLTVASSPEVVPSIDRIRLTTDGKVELTITKGSAELALERSTDFVDWEQIEILTETGTFVFLDESTDEDTGIFYRLATPTDEPADPGSDGETWECVRDTLAAHLQVDPASLRLLQDQAVEWPTACLGCLPGACVQIVTPGRRLMFATVGGAGGISRPYEVRTSDTGTVALVTGNKGIALESCP